MKTNRLYLSNISKDFTINNMKKNVKRIKMKCIFFLLDYSSTNTSEISDILRFLMKETL